MIFDVSGALLFPPKAGRLNEFAGVDLQAFSCNPIIVSLKWLNLPCSSEEESYVSQRMRPSLALAMNVVFNITNQIGSKLIIN
jgi:hypothetical protein